MLRALDASSLVTRNPALPYLWMLSGAMAFALMGTIAHALGAACDWQLIALARSSLALLFSGLLAWRAGITLFFWPSRMLWLRSVMGSFSMICTFYPLTRLPVADVLTLTNMFPIWIALLSGPLLKEWPSGEVWLAVASGVTGVILIQQPHFAEGNFASLLALASSFATAISMLGLHRLQSVDPRAIVFHFSAVAIVVCGFSWLVFDHPLPLENLLDSWTLVRLLGVGVLAATGQLFLTKAFAWGSPARVSVVGLTQIPMAMVLEMILLDRTFGTVTLIGIALVVAPTARLLVSRAT